MTVQRDLPDIARREPVDARTNALLVVKDLCVRIVVRVFLAPAVAARNVEQAGASRWYIP